jgi:nucleotide-binding universal stress UspA family protein
MYKHILLPIDGSTLSLKAAQAGIAFAKSIGAKVTAFYANPGIGMQFFQADVPLPESVFEAEAARLHKLEQRYLGQVRALADKAGVACETASVSDELAYQAIIAAAKKRRCDLVFMASHGRSGLKKVLLGSVATQVLTHSKIPVLIWRR